MSRLRTLLMAAAFIPLAGCQIVGNSWDFMRGHIGASSTALANWTPSEDAVERGAMQFAFGDYGGLNSDAMNTVAVPWKLTAAALVLAQSPDDISPAALERILTGYGFFYPDTIANWPTGSTPPKPEAAVGIVLGTGTRSIPSIEIQIANTGCVACHSAPVYDALGLPDPKTIWLGAPNPSLNLQGYTLALQRALEAGAKDKSRLLDAVQTLYPDVSERELKSLRDFVLPLVDKRLQQIADNGGSALPFDNGHAGVTNGVAALKLQHGMLVFDTATLEKERGFTSIPHLSDRMFRSMLLWDGAYAPSRLEDRQSVIATSDIDDAHVADLAGITAYFTVPTMGMSGAAAVRAIPQVKEAFAFVGTVRPLGFPGSIDMARAERGGRLFSQNCASCHGTYQATTAGPRLQRFPNVLRNVGTDPVRAQANDQALVNKINDSPIRHYIRAESTGTYAAPPLTGIWQSAPYLHNGSVPSLAALLGLEERPVTFLTGGHALNFGTVGVVYPAGYVPYSRPSQVDTTQRGMGNAGHTRMFDDLSVEQRLDLLEYLKRL